MKEGLGRSEAGDGRAGVSAEAAARLWRDAPSCECEERLLPSCSWRLVPVPGPGAWYQYLVPGTSTWCLAPGPSRHGPRRMESCRVCGVAEQVGAERRSVAKRRGCERIGVHERSRAEFRCAERATRVGAWSRERVASLRLERVSTL